MNSNLFYKDLKRNLRAFLAASFSVIFFMGLTMGIYSTMKESMTMITELYSTMPESLLEAIHFGQDQWNTMLGFYVTYFIYYVPLIGGFYAYYLGGRLLAVEEQYKTAEFLLSRPISRNSILLTRLLVCLFYVAAFNILAFLAGLISCGSTSNWDFAILSLTILHLYGLVFCLFIGILGFFIAVCMKKAKSSLMIGIGIVMGAYVMDTILRITDKIQFLSYLTPYKYINVDAHLPSYGLDAWRILVLLSASIILIALSLFIYRRKDILI